VSVGETTVAARSQAITFAAPFGHFSWHRPTDVRVEREGRVSYHPVVDVTRVVQIGFWGLAAVFLLVVVFAGPRRGPRIT
jgi:hypothetical protein